MTTRQVHDKLTVFLTKIRGVATYDSSTGLNNFIDSTHTNLDLISFDVFDTLIHRKVMPPEIAKVPASKVIQDLLRERGTIMSTSEILQARKIIEQRLGTESSRTGYDHEYHLSAVCRAWLQKLMPSTFDEWLVERVIRAEVDAEKRICIPADNMISVVIRARELGIRTVFMSDMYLGFEHVMEILAACGYSEIFHKGYVSSEYKLNKVSGRLFKQMLAEEQIPAGRWLHIGDSIRGDVRSVQQIGGRAILYSPPFQRTRTQRFAKLERLKRVDGQWLGAQWLEQCRRPSQAEGHGSGYSIGYHLLGPLLTNFVHQVIERIRDEAIQLVLFPAREGFILAQIYEKLHAQIAPNTNPDFYYCFLNRKTTYAASVDRIGLREIIMGLHSRRPTLRTLLTRLSLETEEFEPLAWECGLPSLDVPIGKPFETQMKDFKYLQFIRHPKLEACIQKNRQHHKNCLHQYLAQLGFWQKKRVALVDVGWQGTVQDALTCAFENHAQWPRLFGFYLAFLAQPHLVRQTPLSSYEGLIYQAGKQPLGYSPLKHFLILFEMAARAPHGTAIGLKRDTVSGRIVPLLKNGAQSGRQQELRDDPLILSLQQGILDYVEAYQEMLPYQEQPPGFYTTFVMSQLDRFLRFPTKLEAQVLADIFHAEDFGTEIVVQDNGGNDAAVGFKGGMSRFLNRFNTATWKEGALVSRFNPSLAVMWNLIKLFRKDF